MPCIVTTIHDPVALAATCQRFGVPPPEQGCLHLDDQEAAGWIVRLVGVCFPIVCDTLTGLITYHPADNALDRYARLMRFVYRNYDVHAELRRNHPCTHGEPSRRWRLRRLLARQRR